MSKNTFRALLVDNPQGQVSASIRQFDRAALPEGDVLVAVAYSSLNYKDGLAVTGQGRVVRRYPLAPGIDLAGVVVESASPAFKAGDQVVGMGWGLGESHWGGFAQLARLQADWLTPLPAGLDLQQAMAIGTAGFTAMLAVLALEQHHVTPAAGEVVVTGATGGLGSLAVAILAGLGYPVVAATGRTEAQPYLARLGASRIIRREVLGQPPDRPLASGRWAGAVDVVGGDTLASLLASLKPGGSVAACGLAGGSTLNTTVFPFILRGVNLLGVNSVATPRPLRIEVWDRLASSLKPRHLDTISHKTVSLSELPGVFGDYIDGQVRGRTIVDLQR